MSLFGKKEQQEIERLSGLLADEQAKRMHLEALVTPEHMNLDSLRREIDEAKETLAQTREETEDAKVALQKVEQELKQKKSQIIETDDVILLQSFGMYTPRYSYALSDDYKVQVQRVRDSQKAMVKAGSAAVGNTNWTINGDAKKGSKAVKDMQKLLLRAFNSDCDSAIEHVKFNNVESASKRIQASADAVSKLGVIMGISISDNYVRLKLDELYLMYEYQLKKQREKEDAKEARQRQREEARAAKELEEAKKKLEKEQSHYSNELSRIRTQLASAKTEDARLALEEKKKTLEGHIADINRQISDVDYRTANQRAGYVYVISNIGAFGENVYKIGMTRRLDPMDRIDELGDASVPFDFDVHALIFTEDAPKLEAALHNAFEDRKLNFVNHRREFFSVTLDEIKRVIRENYDKTVEFVEVPPAEQFRESMRLRKEAQAKEQQSREQVFSRAT